MSTEKPKKKSKKILIIILIFIVLLLLYSHYVGTMGLEIKEYKIVSTKLNEKYDNLKIVQFGDLKYGHIVDSNYLKGLVDNINKQKPDIVIFTGDLIGDGITISDHEINKIISELSRINANIEVLCIRGDTDYENNYWSKIIPHLNWIDITNNYETINLDKDIPIIIYGIDSLKNKPDYVTQFSYMANTDNYYTIVVMHEPDQIDKITDKNFDLVLAGHSLNGSIDLPFIGPVIKYEGAKKYIADHYKINNKDFYITNGLGTTKFEFRLFNHPSINLFRFYTK